MALAALLHDILRRTVTIVATCRAVKAQIHWLTYSSLARVCKYANRVSYQVLNQHSRLTRGLPET